MSSPEAPAEEAAEPEVDRPAPSPHAELLGELATELGGAIVGSEERRADLWVRVRPDAWHRAAEVCRSLGFDYFCFLSGLDWMPSTAPNPKAGVAAVDTGDDGEGGGDDAAAEAAEAQADEDDAAPPDGLQTGYAGGDTRFQVFARLYSTGRHLGVTLKADLDDAAPRIDTWSDIYAGADWHERETWEMFGFDFTGHPGLIHLYLPGDFEGFPLRKDFPLLSREVKPWPGLVDVEPMPEEPAAEVPANGEPPVSEPSTEEPAS